jgi:cell division protein FtsZ
VDFIVCNTDMKALNGSPVPNKLVLGQSGMGAGNDPEKARRAAESKESEIKELFEHNTKMVFITAGMGGGTGTGAAPVIARFAKEINIKDDDMEEDGKILVVAVVTTPFLFEGKKRLTQAFEGVQALREQVDSILVINNEKLRKYGNLVITDAFGMANDVLLTAVKGIAEIITLNAFVNIDFRDVNTVMQRSGTALMGIGEGEGENRALQAIEQATTSVLLDDNDISGAKNVLLYFSYSPDNRATMDEMGDITTYLCQKTGSDETNVIWGTGEDDTLGDKVKITLIATGFVPKEQSEPVKYTLPEEPKVKPIVPPVHDTTEPHIIPNSASAAASAPQQPVQDIVAQPVIERVPATTPQSVEPQTAQPRRIMLDDDEVKVDVRAKVEQPTGDDPYLVNRQDETSSSHTVETPTVEAPAVQTPSRESASHAHQQPVDTGRTVYQPDASQLEKAAMSRAERIKMMHDLLRNNVNGPAIVERMNPMELTGERLYEAAHSSESSAQRSGVNANGEVKPNDYLFSQVD